MNLASLAAAWRIGFRHHLAYPAELGIQLLAAALVAGLNAALWSSVADAPAGVAGLPAASWRAEVLVAWAGLGAVATRVHEELGERFRDGQLATDLLRPVPLPALIYARDLGRAMAAFCAQSLPLLGLCALGTPLGLSAAPSRWLAWGLLLLLAHALNVAISFALGVASFRLGSITGLGYLKATLVSLFAGALIPIELFGPGLGAVARALPFHVLGRDPAQLLLGRVELGPTLGLAAAWVAGVWLFGVLMWRKAAHSFTVQGG